MSDEPNKIAGVGGAAVQGGFSVAGVKTCGDEAAGGEGERAGEA